MNASQLPRVYKEIQGPSLVYFIEWQGSRYVFNLVHENRSKVTLTVGEIVGVGASEFDYDWDFAVTVALRDWYSQFSKFGSTTNSAEISADMNEIRARIKEITGTKDVILFCGEGWKPSTLEDMKRNLESLVGKDVRLLTCNSTQLKKNVDIVKKSGDGTICILSSRWIPHKVSYPITEAMRRVRNGTYIVHSGGSSEDSLARSLLRHLDREYVDLFMK
jgi:hypothetical protein